MLISLGTENYILAFSREPVLWCIAEIIGWILVPFMEAHEYSEVLTMLFGSGKGSGAALMFLILGVAGTLHCLVFGSILRKYHYS